MKRFPLLAFIFASISVFAGSCNDKPSRYDIRMKPDTSQWCSQCGGKSYDGAVCGACQYADKQERYRRY